jgi:dGTPase
VAHAARLETTHQFDVDCYLAALVAIQTWINDNQILYESFDESHEKSATIRGVVSNKIKEVLSGLRISKTLEDAQRHQLIHLEPDEWHQLQVLKAIAVHSVLSSPAIAIHEHSQVAALKHVLSALEEICTERSVKSVPYPLQDFILAIEPQQRVGVPLRAAIADYICGITDANCVDLARYFCGFEVPEVGRFHI